MRSIILTILLALTLAPAAAARGSLNDSHLGSTKPELQAQISHSTDVLAFFDTHHWMRAPRHHGCTVPWTTVCQRARAVYRAHAWLRRLASARLEALDPPLPPHYSAWLCIHSHEGSWSDSGNPYWGGLQFGSGEWSRFGGRYAPTADRASPLQQMWAAEAYYAVSGFSPWPQTARACGLL